MEVFIGTILAVGFNFAPVGWALCAGQILSIASNTPLFSLIGTYYGGDGVSTFALPNLQGRFIVGMGNGAGLSSYVMGQAGGAQSVALSVANMPAHNHSIVADGAPGTHSDPLNKFLAGNPSADIYTANAYPPSPVLMNSEAITQTGGNQAFSIIPPYLAVNYIIALEGIFPSRD